MSSHEFIEVKIENISLFNYNFIILLRRDTDENVLPICIGAAEAHSIAAAFNKQTFPRPLTHDLLKSILGTMDCTVERIHVNDLKDGTFYARIFLERHGKVFDVDSRPSDAIAVALRYGAPIFVRQDILQDNAVSINQAQEGGAASAQNQAADEEASSAPPLSQQERLKKDLDKAVAEERYEEAARLRDQLKSLQQDN